MAKNKKEKPEKVRKSSETEDGSKKRGFRKILLLIPAVLLAAGAAAGWFLLGRGTEIKLGPSELPSGSAQTEPVAEDSSAGSSAGDSSGENGEVPLAGAPSAGAPAVLTAPQTSKTVSDCVDYIGSLSPGALGLEGESMEDYEIIPQNGIVLVDGQQCAEVFVYARDEKTGTNQFLGDFLLGRADSRLYRLDQESGTVTPVDLSGTVNS